MLPHPHPNLLPKVVVKTVLVSSPTPFPPCDGAHVRQACFCAPQLTKVLQNGVAETKASKSQAWNKPQVNTVHTTHLPALLAAAAPAVAASSLLEC